MNEKRDFVRHLLEHMRSGGRILEWKSGGESNRYDYEVDLQLGRTAAIELKGCLDGNNTNIFERPPNADEFIIWSLCTNSRADPRHNAWSGIHTRLSAEIISRKQQVDGVVIWDMMCGTLGRPCPKAATDSPRRTQVGPFSLPPPCLYLFPSTVPSPRNNPHPRAQRIEAAKIMRAFSGCFACQQSQISEVEFDVAHRRADIVRATRIVRGDKVQQAPDSTPIRRS